MTATDDNAAMTAEQAAVGLALRGLQSETREEMEQRHFDERTFGYTTEEFAREMAGRHVAELAALEIRERAEPMMLEAIERSRWAAVDKPIPEAPSDELLKVAREAAAWCVDETKGYIAYDRESPDDGSLEYLRAAEARVAELDAIAQAREQAREPLTADAIARDPWNAVALDLPQEMSVDLAALVVNTAFELRQNAWHEGQAAEARGGAAEAERFFNLGNEAEQRREDALLKYDMAKARDAWQAPEFSRATIDADAWTAVYLPMPAKADPGLLLHARSWARDLARYAEGDGALSEPLVDPERYTREENIEAATARVAELEARLEIVSEARQAREAAAAPVAPEQSTSLTGEPERAAQAAIIGASGYDGNFLSLGFIATRIGASLANSVEMVLDTVFGFFVAEPKLTPQQVHDTLQASGNAGNLDVIHAREAAALTAENQAAHEDRMLLAKSGQQEQDLYLSMTLGTNPTAEANLGIDAPAPEIRRGRSL